MGSLSLSLSLSLLIVGNANCSLHLSFETLMVCLVGGEIGMRENRTKNCWEECLVGRERGREFWWSPGVFSPDTPKHNLPKLGRMGEKIV